MRLLKWLFQPVYLLLIVVLVALYVNREVIFSDEVVESLEARALINRVDEMVDKLRETSTDLLASTEDKQINDSVEIADAQEDKPVEAVVLAAESAEDATEIPPVVPEEENSSEVESSEGPSETSFSVTTDIAADTATTDAVPASPPAIETEKTPIDVWQQARRAVWQGELDTAVSNYRQLIALQPDNYDAYGEMGNVLLSQSDVSGAVDAYSTSARLIRQSGNVEMAHRLATVVARLDEEQGRALFNEFWQR